MPEYRLPRDTDLLRRLLHRHLCHISPVNMFNIAQLYHRRRPRYLPITLFLAYDSQTGESRIPLAGFAAFLFHNLSDQART